MESLINAHAQRGAKVLTFSDNSEVLKHCAITLEKPQLYGETKDVEWLHCFNHRNSYHLLVIQVLMYQMLMWLYKYQVIMVHVVRKHKE